MKLLYFAWLRSKIGFGEEDLELPAEITTLAQLVAWLPSRSAGHAAAFSQSNLIRAAVNQDYAQHDHVITNADEVAFFPPVTGGAP